MSIPPLVCSTPPPPDQCEDEKISDDFDIGYNLSQEYEEQNAYELNDYCTFNTYKISDGSISIEDIDTLKTLSSEKELPKDIESRCGNDEQDNYSSSPFEEKKIDEDNIEDLDLQLEDITSVNAKESSKELDENTLGSISGLTDTSVNIDQIETVTSSPIFDNDPSVELSETDIEKDKNDSVSNLNFEDNKILNSEEPNFTTNFQDEKGEKINESDLCMKELEILNHSENDINVSNNISINLKSDTLSDVGHDVCSVKTDHILQAPYNSQSIDLCVQDDDFGDFDDFQFTSGNINDNGLFSESNPWTNSDAEDITFKANFDEMQIPSISNQSPSPNVEPKLEPGENDTFDDFDDFKSSENDNVNKIEIKYETDTQKSCSLSPLDIHLSQSDMQITEIVDKVLSSVFQEEISTDDAQPERILSSFLCETWGYLTEAEVRQPYIVNWNNSLNQKTLLKALCIDSRNILFGPKWNHNMPKYAANLGSSPLQPKKSNATFPSANDSCSSSALNTDNWSEPINIEGKEFTYAEALLLDLEHLMATLDQMAHNHSALKISELLSSACSNDDGASSDKVQQEADEFSQTLPTKSEKIYPNSLNLQPIRQINLPDTHIYTPTDSEIPRSKTIHYDIGAPILIPQLANDATKTKYDTSRNDIADDEYSEFQDFQCGTTNLNPHTVNPQPPDKGEENKAIIETFQTFNLESNSVLQPIKVEPKLPTLNWPDPGEVKEMFVDFTDFATHSMWDKNKESVFPDSMNTLKSEVPLFITVTNTSDTAINPVSLNTNFSIDKNICMTDFDDEFDTFQSALPISNSSQAFQTLSTDINEIEKPMDSGHVQTITPEQSINKTKDSKFSSFVLSDLKQLSGYNNSGDCTTLKTINQTVSESGAVSTTVSTIAKTTTLTHNSLVTDNKILQPIPSSSLVINHSKPSSGQILQPLSLESYTQINWPNPGISLQDLSAFNPVKTIQTIKAEASSSHSKNTTPTHVQKNQATDDEMWSDFVSVNPKVSPQLKKQTFAEDDEWSDFISSPNINPQNGLNTISLNVHTNLSMQNSLTHSKHKQGNKHIDIPTLNYITPKSNTNRAYTDRHFQNL